MKAKYNKVWKYALPYLEKPKRKDFVLHTKGVIKAMELILKEEKENERVLMTAAILHDVGWYNVPHKLQISSNKKDSIKAQKLHIKNALPIIKQILEGCKYKKSEIKRVLEIVEAHKFKNPIRKDKRIMIDADTLSDVFKEQYESDFKSYGTNPERHYIHRMKNTFYTKTARKIFKKEMEKRRKQFNIPKTILD